MPDTQPLLLLTRPRAASERFVQELAEDGISGFTPVISPLIEVEPTARCRRWRGSPG